MEEQRDSGSAVVVVRAGANPIEIERMIFRAITEEFDLEIESAPPAVVTRHHSQLAAAGFVVSSLALQEQPDLARFQIRRRPAGRF